MKINLSYNSLSLKPTFSINNKLCNNNYYYLNIIKYHKNVYYHHHSSPLLLCQNIEESKHKLILSEYNLLKHIDPDKVPTKLEKKHLEYLMSLFAIKGAKSHRSLKIDISYKLRELTFQKLRDFENFQGTNSLCCPFTGFEVRLITTDR